MSPVEHEQPDTRQERREERLDKKKEKMPQHGKQTGRLYKEAIVKRIRHLRDEKEKGKEA